ncbi:16S rRNA (cytidine(1402)-2'-O)-methyltransferase [Parahaliea maris]|uniref:Ribosomal RNA small subunit methyltransferase I n=1 Tax=Parahaliea maris TaxID=2716870 RepID=A0A5C9A679_9GAMM|nr:16S rRNA (cytidine(1402)-2'-O)-methyltransferase [Parahaliea maris]TXS96338.1 16S rRNA (cytidine(1402)-2'-O)-methyltransferase [Parahaliea maris]
MESGLYVVATPIGNLGDITQRALDVLAAADLVAAEDTRTTRGLLARFNIDNTVFAYHDHSDPRAARRIVDCVAGGGVVALVSDAGTPLISDPGYRLVRELQEAGLPVIPVPGACAAVAALCASGLPTDRFLFEGFLPGKAAGRQARLQALAERQETLVFYEAPHRVLDCVGDMRAAFGDAREALLAREVTKAFETLRRAPLAELEAFIAADPNQQRGEIVLVVAGQREKETTIDADTARLLRRLAEELPPKRAAAVVAEHTGLRKKQLYDFLLQDQG